jgi:transcriptional regulator with XRE-family HTH domain
MDTTKSEIRIEVGKRLKEGRKQAGLTQAALAEELFMTQQQYSRFENGVFELNYEQIVFLCKRLEISADFLFGLQKY